MMAAAAAEEDDDVDDGLGSEVAGDGGKAWICQPSLSYTVEIIYRVHFFQGISTLYATLPITDSI